jgi:hypothetical protein
MKNLEIGKNYGGIFGLNADSGKKMIYNGGDRWTAVKGEQSQTMDSAKTTAAALEYINRPSCGTGIR